MKARQTKTKNYIKTALTQLLREKNFEEISVTMICQKAGINRGTFYLHYLDKYDMMEQQKEETLAHFFTLLQSYEGLNHESLETALTYIAEQKDFFYALSQSSYVNLPQAIKNFISTLFDRSPRLSQSLLTSSQIPIIYQKISVIASIEAIISHWIQEGCQESPQYMANILQSIALQ